MSIYKSWIKKHEILGFEKHASIKIAEDFDWGLKYLDIDEQVIDPYERIVDYNKSNIRHSNKYFIPSEEMMNVHASTFENNILSFKSPIFTHVENNNIVKMQLYPVENKRSVVIVVPHWNAPGITYHKICKKLQSVKIPCLRYILPYHPSDHIENGNRIDLGRDNGTEFSSTLMVSPNVGMTIKAMQQSVQDLIYATNWLDSIGYEKIGILGFSIGSCAGFIAACHEPKVSGFFANHMSSYFGDVVWTGRSTQHIRKSYDIYNSLHKDNLLTQDIIKNVFLLNSPNSYLGALTKNNQKLKQFVIAGKFDDTFKLPYTLKYINALKDNKIHHRYIQLPCGHYSLGKFWFKYIDALFIYGFFRNLFSTKQ